MALSHADTVESLRWKKFPVLNDGFVCLVDVMGDDSAVVQAARVSYGKDTRDGRPTNQSDIDGGNWHPDTSPDPEQAAKNRKLLRYMMSHGHTSPFEMVEFKFLVRIPMDAWRQMVRHRTANINEYSTRYSEAIDSQQQTDPDLWRTQSQTNKQGSGEFLPKEEGTILTGAEAAFHHDARKLYQSRLQVGVAREQARKDLPLSTFTEAYWKIDLHNLFHFLNLRMDGHAQKEIRDYATTIAFDIVAKLVPDSWEAFEDYKLNTLQLSRMEVGAMSILLSEAGVEISEALTRMGVDSDSREGKEAIVKFQRLGAHSANGFRL